MAHPRLPRPAASLRLLLAFGAVAALPALHALIDTNQDGISDLWAALYPSAGAPTADPDNDGLANLLEYATGLSPVATGTSAPLQIGSAAAGTVTLSYRRRTDVTDVALHLQTSNDLVSWTDVDTAAATVAAISGEPLVQLRSLTFPVPATRIFYRLVATPQ